MSNDTTFAERIKRRRFVRLSGAVGAGALAGCSSQEELQGDGGDGGDGSSDGSDSDDGGDGGASGGDPIGVGVVIPFSGDLSDFGQPMLNGLQLALEDINAAGGPLGREIELFDEDSET
ncbi:ABC transporter substrate-binding protein, partial [Halorubrum sp. SP3]